MNNKTKNKIKIIFTSVLMVISFPLFSYATTIENNVNVSSNTGNNTVEPGGKIIKGKQEAKIEVENIIDGQSIDPIKIETDRSEASVEIKVEVNDNENKATVKKTINIDGEEIKSTSNIEINSVVSIGFWASIFNSVSNFFKSIFSFI